MPWHIISNHSGCPASKPYAVIKDATGELDGCHKTNGEAMAQMKALYASERGTPPYRVSQGATGCPKDKPWGVIDPAGKLVDGCGCHDSEAGAKSHMAAYWAGQAASPTLIDVRSAESYLARVLVGDEVR